MPVYENGPLAIHYDDEGEGFPILLIAPGGMRSANELWNDMPWNPRSALADDFRLIGMDQRNAGRSVGPITAETGWATYRGDQLALLDHLGIERCHVLGMCIGGPYIMGLLGAAPERFTSAVILQPVGIDDNRETFHDIFAQWSDGLATAHPHMAADDWASFRDNMWAGEFVLTASPADVEVCEVPLLVAMGDDQYHPSSTSRRIAELAPNATLVEEWKLGSALVAFDETVGRFLAAHTP